jgi:hypothetical protein
MADSYYKLVGTPNPHTNWTTEVVLERDEDGNVTKSVGAVPSKLNADDRKKVEEMGFTLEQVSKEEAEAAAATPVAGADVSGAAPVFGDADAANQPAGRSGGTDQK